MFDDLDKDLNKIDWFPNVKAHIAIQPIRCQRALAKTIEQELSDQDIGAMLFCEKTMLESYLHELIEYCMELYYESRKDMPND